MSYLKRHKDTNHAEVVRAFRACGASVEVHEPTTAGAPDLIVGLFGHNLLVEVKPGDAKDKRQRELRASQLEWHQSWRGRVDVVRSVDDVMLLVASIRGASLGGGR